MRCSENTLGVRLESLKLEKHDVFIPVSLTLFMPLISCHCVQTPFLLHKKRLALWAFALLFLLPKMHYAANLHPPSNSPN